MRDRITVIRPAAWSEVCNLFYGHGGGDRAQAMAAQWAGRFGRAVEDYSCCRVVLQSWPVANIKRLMQEMSRIEPRMTVDIVSGINKATTAPRVQGLPVCVVRFGDRIGMIDGKHRANNLRDNDPPLAVLMIEATK
jgi:hypothetical protein